MWSIELRRKLERGRVKERGRKGGSQGEERDMSNIFGKVKVVQEEERETGTHNYLLTVY